MDDGKAYLSEEDYLRVSTALLYYIINLQDLCSPNTASSSSSSSSSLSYEDYLRALTNLHPTEDRHFLSSNETESVLQLINQHYQGHALETTTSSRSQVLTGPRKHVEISLFSHI